MRRTRLSLYYLVGYLWPTGLGLLFFPREFLKLTFSNGEYGDVMPRVAGGLIVALGIVVAQIIRRKVEALYTTTLVVRVHLLAVMVAMYLYARDPFFLVVMGVVGVGVTFTTLSYLWDRRRTAVQAPGAA